MLRLPGVADLESKLLLNPPVRGVHRPVVDDMADNLSRATFGIARDDTLFDPPEGYKDLIEGSRECWEIHQAHREHELRFKTADAMDDEAVDILLGLGLDFRGDNNQPLRCTKLLCRQAEAAARGLMGRLPDQTAIDLTAWESKIERDAQQFMSRRK
jgi:hypothetical protein